MVKNNGIPIEVNKKPFETVYELKNETPSFEEFMKTYEADEKVIDSYRDEVEYVNVWGPKGSGPCRNSSCDCYCSADWCICSNYDKYRGSVESGRSIRINKKTRIKGFQHLIHTGNDLADKHGGPSTARGEWWDGDATGYSDGSFRFSSLTSSAGSNAGIGGAIASGGAGYSTFGIKDSSGEAKFLSLSAGGEIGAGPGGVVAGYSASADLASVQAGGFSANVGYDAGSGVSFGVGGVEAKVAGVGVSIGKKMGISTPFGGVSVDLEEACVVQ